MTAQARYQEQRVEDWPNQRSYLAAPVAAAGASAMNRTGLGVYLKSFETWMLTPDAVCSGPMHVDREMKTEPQ